jgi:caa(3)-type oxidase subunit IV
MSDSHASEPATPAPVSAQQIEEIKKHVGGYVKIGFLQMIVAVVTVGASFVFSSTATQVAVTLLIATFNGLLVAGILMHLKEEKKTIWKFLIFTGIFFFILFFLTYLARTDAISQTVLNHH